MCTHYPLTPRPHPSLSTGQSSGNTATQTSGDHAVPTGTKEHAPPALPLTSLSGSLNSLPPGAFAAVGLAAQCSRKLKFQIHRQSETRESSPCQENEIPLESSRPGKRQPTNEFSFGQTHLKNHGRAKQKGFLVLLLFLLT